jgi:hypothetical protein
VIVMVDDACILVLTCQTSAVYGRRVHINDERMFTMTVHELQSIAPDAPDDGNEVLFSSVSLYICW